MIGSKILKVSEKPVEIADEFNRFFVNIPKNLIERNNLQVDNNTTPPSLQVNILST
jgi:hypothetical protein